MDGDSVIEAVDDVDLAVDSGQTLGIVGESGCGKSTVIKSIIGILDENGAIRSGNIRLHDEDITQLSTAELNERIRWKEISYIPQDAMAALDPVHTIGSQIVQVIRQHSEHSKREARERTEELLVKVGLDPNRYSDYPHELSGGQRQRAVIALALALEPSLILADEPTTGLDVVVQDEILELLEEIQTDLGCAIVLVTHDMSVVAEVADSTAVMYGGRIMEFGGTETVFNRSAHPYTIGLKNAFPSLERNSDVTQLISIPGTPPNLQDPPSGCRFESRCPFADEKCVKEEPPIIEVPEGQLVKCHYTDQRESFRNRGKSASLWEGEIDE